MMDYRDALIGEIAEIECKRLVRKVIRFLQQAEAGLSGDDSGLKSVWDEVCVQVRAQESVHWDDYLSTIEDLIARWVKVLAVPAKKALWLQTNSGTDWQCDREEETENAEEADGCPYCEDDVVDYVLRAVLSAADNWSNARIEDYLARS
jgi:hypothetical protein